MEIDQYHSSSSCFATSFPSSCLGKRKENAAIICQDPQFERQKQVRLKAEPVTQKDLASFNLNVFIRFSKLDTLVRGKIVCKQAWGSLICCQEDAINSDNEVAAFKGAQVWCRWQGTVDSTAVPIFEAMYT